MIENLKIKSLVVTVDTDDWENETDAERCNNLIIDLIEPFIEINHDRLIETLDADNIACTYSELSEKRKKLVDLAEVAFNRVTKDYITRPDCGHNYSVHLEVKE